MLYEKLYLHITFIAFLSTWCIVPSYCANEQCIQGVYHKDKPSPETDEYKFCKPWKNLTCCTVELDNEVYENDSPKKYNQTWHLCGDLSAKCVEHWKRQECFYQCSPYVYQWKNSMYKGAITGVPICASECDDWYEACKNDRICVENVLEDYNQTENYVPKCPTNSRCMKYSEMYKNGENLCNKMWGNSYKYVKKNGDNCMKFWFSAGTENPNAKVLKDVNGSTPTSSTSSLFRLLLLPFLYAAMTFTL